MSFTRAHVDTVKSLGTIHHTCDTTAMPLVMQSLVASPVASICSASAGDVEMHTSLRANARSMPSTCCMLAAVK